MHKPPNLSYSGARLTVVFFVSLLSSFLMLFKLSYVAFTICHDALLYFMWSTLNCLLVEMGDTNKAALPLLPLRLPVVVCLRPCSHLTLTCILDNLITGRQLWIPQFTPEIRKVSTIRLLVHLWSNLPPPPRVQRINALRTARQWNKILLIWKQNEINT